MYSLRRALLVHVARHLHYLIITETFSLEFSLSQARLIYEEFAKAFNIRRSVARSQYKEALVNPSVET